MPSRQHRIADAPPNDAAVTVYDRNHLKLYMRLLDASEAGATLEDVASLLLGIDANKEPERAQRLLAELRNWRRSVAAQMPTRNPRYDPSKALLPASR